MCERPRPVAAFLITHSGHVTEIYGERNVRNGQWFLACHDCETEFRLGGLAQVTGRLMRHVEAARIAPYRSRT